MCFKDNEWIRGFILGDGYGKRVGIVSTYFNETHESVHEPIPWEQSTTGSYYFNCYDGLTFASGGTSGRFGKYTVLGGVKSNCN